MYDKPELEKISIIVVSFITGSYTADISALTNVFTFIAEVLFFSNFHSTSYYGACHHDFIVEYVSCYYIH